MKVELLNYGFSVSEANLFKDKNLPLLMPCHGHYCVLIVPHSFAPKNIFEMTKRITR